MSAGAFDWIAAQLGLASFWNAVAHASNHGA
jgi:hypothetical protein